MPKLTLSRREGESLVIDHDIKVTINYTQGKRVSITIEAPEEVDIVREELILGETKKAPK